MIILSVQNAHFGAIFWLGMSRPLIRKNWLKNATQGSITCDVLDHVGKLESRTSMFIL